MQLHSWIFKKVEVVSEWLKTNRYAENIPFIVVGIFSGLACCGYAILFSAAEDQSKKIFSQHPLLLFFLSPFLIALSFWLVKKFAPGAAGSGIPQVIVCLEKDYRTLIPKFLSPLVSVWKIGTSLLAVFAGAAIGREGPSLQISASISQTLGSTFEKFGMKIKTEQLIIAGAASGLAAAFNTPIGGIVYAVEELTQDHIRSYKTSLLMAVLIAGITAQLFLGNYLYLGYPPVPSILNFEMIALVALVSLMCGLLGALFSKLLLFLSDWRKKYSTRTQIFFALFAGLFLSTSFFFFGERSLYSGKDSINTVLFSKEPLQEIETVLRFLSPLISSMTGIAGGIFAPSLSAGATVGGLISNFFDPTLRTILGLSGMIGFLTGVTRTPITSFVLVLEMTDRHSAVFPMMLAAVFSSLGSHLVGSHSYYEEVAERLKGEYHEAHSSK